MSEHQSEQSASKPGAPPSGAPGTEQSSVQTRRDGQGPNWAERVGKKVSGGTVTVQRLVAPREAASGKGGERKKAPVKGAKEEVACRAIMAEWAAGDEAWKAAKEDPRKSVMAFLGKAGLTGVHVGPHMEREGKKGESVMDFLIWMAPEQEGTALGNEDGPWKIERRERGALWMSTRQHWLAQNVLGAVMTRITPSATLTLNGKGWGLQVSERREEVQEYLLKEGLGVVRKTTYDIRGLPKGADTTTIEEVVKEAGWKAVVIRTIPKQGGTVAVLQAEAPPSFGEIKWQGGTAEVWEAGKPPPKAVRKQEEEKRTDPADPEEYAGRTYTKRQFLALYGKTHGQKAWVEAGKVAPEQQHPQQEKQQQQGKQHTREQQQKEQQQLQGPTKKEEMLEQEVVALRKEVQELKAMLEKLSGKPTEKKRKVGGKSTRETTPPTQSASRSPSPKPRMRSPSGVRMSVEPEEQATAGYAAETTTSRAKTKSRASSKSKSRSLARDTERRRRERDTDRHAHIYPDRDEGEKKQGRWWCDGCEKQQPKKRYQLRCQVDGCSRKVCRACVRR
eukprot:TRINITY_DN274_c0_g1_i7.p2 TRINITY_DN274_c0_g1~~TRINITY_DN274_c0_g1_i7.p2  ORF type:complete len:561 (+),score=180.89 TRINITY_DN274_c0_g1_i7:232-1914(+)